MVSLVSIDKIYDREVILELERRQAASAFFTGYMGFTWSEVQILSPRQRALKNCFIELLLVAPDIHCSKASSIESDLCPLFGS